MNEVLSVGLILLAALVAGHLAQLARVPEVTGYLLVGVAIGPSLLDLITHDNLRTLGFLSEVALGLILFSIGSIFEAHNFRRLGPGAARITLAEAGLSFLLVAGGTLLAGISLPAALLLGVIAMETAPATTLMVLHEYDASGPMTERLLALVALNNMLVLAAFGVVSAGLTLAGGGEIGWLGAAWQAGHGLAWSIAGSIALGVVLGLVIDAWAARVKEAGEAMILAMGVVLVAVGAARGLGLSSLVASLALGATVVNTSHHGDALLRALGRADPPLYAAFFVLAGAELQLGSLGALGLAGLAYVVGRAAGKIGGTRLGTRGQGLDAVVERNLGLCLLSSSSLAVGLTIQVRSTFPELAPAVTPVVLASVLIFEILGPLATRRALFRTGEARTIPDPLREVASTPAEL